MASFFDKLVDKIFNSIRKEKENQAEAALAADPEYQKLLKKREELIVQQKKLVDEANIFIEEMNKKYPNRTKRKNK